MNNSAPNGGTGLLLPIGQLPDYPLMVVMTYLQGIYKPATGHSWTAPQGRNWRHRSKLVVPTSYDVDWYRPLGPTTGIKYNNEMFELLDQQYRWAALSAMRLTCKRFAALSEKVVPLFSLWRQLRVGSVPMGVIQRPLTASIDPEHREQPKDLSWVTPTELLLVESSGVKSGVLKPHLFRSRVSPPLPLPEPTLDLALAVDSETLAQLPVTPAQWYGNLARHVHTAFSPLVLPSAYEAPLTGLQIASSAQRHYFTLKRSLAYMHMISACPKLVEQTTIDYFIGEWRMRMDEDCESHVRFRLKIELPGDRELEAPPRYLHFKSVVVQGTSFVHARTASDAERDPINLSPFFIRKSNSVTMRPPQGYVGLHMLAVETEDAILAAALDLPSPEDCCSTIVMMIENGARGILEPHTRADPRVFVPVMLIRSQFMNNLASLLELPMESPQELKDSTASISQWLSAVSMVDYSTPTAPERKYDLDRMYSYSFLQLETPTQGPLSPSYILNPHAFHLEPEIGHFLGASIESEYFSTSSELPATHSKPLPNSLAFFYHKAIDSILEQYRWSNIVMPVIERLGRAELDVAMHDPLARLCARTKILDHTEVDFQCIPQTVPTALDILPVSMYSTFEIRTDDPRISLRFTHRRYPMALSLSIVAPTTLEAWQWATKRNVLLNYFHYGCTPFYVPMPDLSHLSSRYTDVLSVTFLPTVPGFPQPTWTSDPLITNTTLASTSVNCLEELETRDSVCFFRWDPSIRLEECRKAAQQSHGVPIDLQLVETLASAVGVPELSCDQFMALLIRAFGQGFGKIPQTNEQEPQTTSAPVSDSPVHAHAFSTGTTETTLNGSISHARTTLQNPTPTTEKEIKGTDSPSSFSAPSSASSGADAKLNTKNMNDTMDLKETNQEESSSTSETLNFLKSAKMPSNIDRMHAYEHASVISSKKLTAPFGSSRIRWRPTTLVVETPETNWSCISISMIRQYSHLSQEQIRWADYSLLHPSDFELPSQPQANETTHDQIHPSNVYVDPAVVGHYPDLLHSVYKENGVPFVLLMMAGDQVISMQLVKSTRKRKLTQTPPNDDSLPSVGSKTTSSSTADYYVPRYEVNPTLSDDEAEFCVVWRRGQSFHVVTAHSTLLRAKSIFSSRFAVFTGQPWTLKCHTQGWKVAKCEATSAWDAPKISFPSRYLQPTHLDPAIFYEHIPLADISNQLMACLMPPASVLRFWARFYRLVMADLPRSLELVKLALLNDESDTEDRVLSLMEYAEWARACGNARATLEAVNAANMTDSAHPLPWLAKADLTYLASLQASDPQTEMLRIEQAGALYSRFLNCAQLIVSVSARNNVPPSGKDTQVSDLVAAADDKSEPDNGTEVVALSQAEMSTGSGSLAAQTPSVVPMSLASVMASKSALVTKIPAPMSLVHMRRAQWACGKLLQRLDRFAEAKACYDELLRKYFKRERLELTLDRCATLLALRKPKEAAETIIHALEKESASSFGSQQCNHSIYFRHVNSLRARGWLLLSAAHLATASTDASITALSHHRRLDPKEPRAMIIEILIRQARHASKPDSRTRMRQHGAQVMGMGFRRAPGAPLPNAFPLGIGGPPGVQAPPAQPGLGQAANILPAAAPNFPAPGLAPGAQPLPAQPLLAQVAPPLQAPPPNQALPLPTRETSTPALNVNLILSYLRNPDPFGSSSSKLKTNTSISANKQKTNETEVSSAPTDNDTSPVLAEPSSSAIGPNSLAKSKLSQKPHVQQPDSASSSSSPTTVVSASSSSVNPSSMMMDTVDRSASPIVEREATVSNSDDDDEPLTVTRLASPPIASSRSPVAHLRSSSSMAPSSSAAIDFDGEPKEVSLVDESFALPSSSASEVADGGSESVPKLGDDIHGRPTESTLVEGEADANGKITALPPYVRNAAIFRRFYGFVRYSHWEQLTPLLSLMVDASSMRRKLLPPRVATQTLDHASLCLPEATLLSALSILERIRDLVDEALALDQTELDVTKREECKKDLETKIHTTEAEYFKMMPHLRRIRISFFVSEEIVRVVQLLEASYACTILQRALELKHDFESNVASPAAAPTSIFAVDSREAHGSFHVAQEPASSSGTPSFWGSRLTTVTHTLPDLVASSSPTLLPSTARKDSLEEARPPLSPTELISAETDAYDHKFIADAVTHASSSAQPLNPPPTLFATSLVERILQLQSPAFSGLIQRDALPNAPLLPQPNYDIPENTFSSLPVKYVLDVLSEEVTLTPLDRRTTKGQQILNAVGRAKPLRVVAVHRRNPSPRPTVKSQRPVDVPSASLSAPADAAKEMASTPPLALPLLSTQPPPPTLLWHVVPTFSIARILMKGLQLNPQKSVRSLTFTTALGNYNLHRYSVAILVEVQLGNVYYCGPEQATPPPGYDSLAIINRFTKIKDDDGSEFFLPQNNDSVVPLFKVFDQGQIGSVRYILQDYEDPSLPGLTTRSMHLGQ